MYDTVLFPTDGSPAMETVAEHARSIAARRDATVRVLYVVDDRAFLTLDDSRIPDVTDQLYEEGERAVSKAADAFAADGIDASVEIRKGSPAEEIIAATEEHGVDLVVMGTHGADPDHNLLGSTVREVVTKSAVPVHAVPIAEAEPDADRSPGGPTDG